MKGSTNAQPQTMSNTTNCVQIASDKYLCWGYVSMPSMATGTGSNVTVNLPVTAKSAGGYYPVVSRIDGSGWGWDTYSARVTNRTTTSFRIDCWNASGQTGSMDFSWIAVITTA